MTTPKFDPKRIVIALDFASASEARALLTLLNPSLCRVKIGKELFTSAGPAFVKEVIAMGFDVFLDLKFHDSRGCSPWSVDGQCPCFWWK